ncbi:MAG: hypothetical protein QXP98_05845 [Thermoproteus sp.]
MGSKISSKYVVVVVLVLVVVAALAFRFLARPARPTGSSSVWSGGVVPPPSVPVGVSVVVVGPPPFVENMTALFPDARPMSASSLPYLQNNSIVFIDWDYLLNNSNATLAVEHIRPLMDRHIFAVFAAGNSSEALRLELLLADMWATTNGAKPVAIPIVPNNRGLRYVVIAPMGHILMIAQTNKEGALQRLAAWLNITGLGGVQTSAEALAPYALQTTSGYTYHDFCADLASTPGLSNVENSYVYWFGQQEAGDGNGTFVVDYCFEMANHIVGALQGGVPWTSAWAYNYIEYVPSPTLTNNGGYIVSMATFQDAYSSYECYATPGYTPPEGFCDYSGVPMGYFTIGNWYPQAISTPQVTISIPASMGAPALIGLAYNLTMVFTPNENVGVGQTMNQYPMDTALYVVLPYGSSKTQELDLPVGSSALIYTGSPRLFTCDYELWGSGIEWMVFWPSPPIPLWQTINPMITITTPQNAQFYDGAALYMASWSTFCW